MVHSSEMTADGDHTIDQKKLLMLMAELKSKFFPGLELDLNHVRSAEYPLLVGAERRDTQ